MSADRTTRRARVAVGAVAVLVLAAFFRDLIGSGFDRIPGGRVDTRFLIGILEHWRTVLLHGAPLASPPFFAPERGVLGYSEGMALFAPPYVAWRALGLDRYHAFAASAVVVKALGFAAMFLALRRIAGVERLAATAGAALFTLWNGYWLAAGHTQLMTVAFVPVVALLVHGWVSTGRPWPLVAAAALVALMLLTSFYIGWFTIFVGAMLVAVGGVATASGAFGRPQLTSGDATRALRHLALALLAFAVAVAPFLYVYLPSMDRLGGRTAEEVWLYLPRPSDVWNVGDGNRVWGPVLSPFVWGPRYVYAHYEAQRGWPPLTLAAFLATLVAAAWRLARGDRRAARWAWTAAVAGGVAVLGWLVIQRIGDFAPWWYVYRLVPGATAIRVPVRFCHVLTCLVIAVVAVGLDRVARSGRLGGATAAVLALLLVAEQWNDTPVAFLSRVSENQSFSAIRPPPPGCRVFYVAREYDGEPDITTDTDAQVDAIFVAQDYGIATINGYSGSRPPGWNLDTTLADYEDRAREWAAAHDLRGLCRLERSSGRWEPVPVPDTTSR